MKSVINYIYLHYYLQLAQPTDYLHNDNSPHIAAANFLLGNCSLSVQFGSLCVWHAHMLELDLFDLPPTPSRSAAHSHTLWLSPAGSE